MIHFILNEDTIATDLPPGIVLLDFIRYHKHLMGTKIGCREGDCGACTVLVGKMFSNDNDDNSVQYESMTSCLMPLGNVHGKHIVTIEGINFPSTLNPIQEAMAEEGATQCGFCTPGFVMSLAGYCLNRKENAIAAIDGNICRCTGYKSIERAAAKLEKLLTENNEEDPIAFATTKKILPSYFSEIKNKLKLLHDKGIYGNGEQLRSKDSKHPTSNLSEGVRSPSDQHPTILGGGTDLYVQKHEEMVHAPARYFFDQSTLNGIRKENNRCIMGASVTVTDLKNSTVISEIFPSFQKYSKLISSTPIRNMATIAGNFVNASPIGDMTVFFLALNADITLQSENLIGQNGNGRTIALRNFYLGYKKLDKTPDEYISEVSFELPANNSYFNFEKVSKRTHLDIASVNSAIYLELKGDLIGKVSLSAGGVGPVPMYLEKTAAYLSEKKLSDDLIIECIEIMKTEISPISDARGTKEYKTLLLGQLIKAHFLPLLNQFD